jgi:hypothetical protein
MVRVLKPGGQIVIYDVEHLVNACAARLPSAGVQCTVTHLGQNLGYEMGIVYGKKVS